MNDYIEYTVKVCADGTKRWYLNGKQHREDGPAVELDSGAKFWYLNDKPHREDGPAVEWADGDKCWYLNGKLHREDGPAVELDSGAKFWYLNGKELTEKEFNERTKKPCVSKVVTIEGIEYKLVPTSKG